MKRSTLYKIMMLASLLLFIMILEHSLPIDRNPITIPLVILFWLGIAYLVIPRFLKKYQTYVLLAYGVIILVYFFNFFGVPDYEGTHRLNFINILLLPIPIFAGLWLFEQWRWLQTLQSEKTKAELSMLKNQVNPHFFFNTLNNLYGLAVEKSDEAPALILKLSDMMRYSLYEAKADYVDLSDEILYLEDYIALQQLRYQKKVTITVHKDVPYKHQIAPLLLIVLLENAFKHGVDSLAEEAFVKVEIRTTERRILYSVKNNFQASSHDVGGLGLENLKKRLALIYPNNHQLNITNIGEEYEAKLLINLA